MKKIFTITSTVITLFIAGVGLVNAQEGYVPLAPLGAGLGGEAGSNTSITIATYLQNIFNFLIAIAAVLAVVMITIGGIRYMTTTSEGGKGGAREQITYAIGGLVLAIAAWLILFTINPALLNFDFVNRGGAVAEEERGEDGRVILNVEIKTTDIFASINQPFSHKIEVTGAVGFDFRMISSDSFPSGGFETVELTPTGVFRGTAGKEGSFPFTIEVEGAVGTSERDTATQTITFHVNSGEPLSVESDFATINAGEPLVKKDALRESAGLPLEPYTIKSSGGTRPYSFSIISGSLPPGLSLEQSTGIVSGTPDFANPSGQTFTATVEVTDKLGDKQSGVLKFNVNNPTSSIPPSNTISIETNTLRGTLGEPFSKSIFNVSGGQEPYTYRITGFGEVPGLSLNQSTGIISGTPERTTIRGNSSVNFEFYELTVQVTDSTGQNNSARVEIIIDGY